MLSAAKPSSHINIPDSISADQSELKYDIKELVFCSQLECIRKMNMIVLCTCCPGQTPPVHLYNYIRDRVLHDNLPFSTRWIKYRPHKSPFTLTILIVQTDNLFEAHLVSHFIICLWFMFSFCFCFNFYLYFFIFCFFFVPCTAPNLAEEWLEKCRHPVVHAHLWLAHKNKPTMQVLKLDFTS